MGSQKKYNKERVDLSSKSSKKGLSRKEREYFSEFGVLNLNDIKDNEDDFAAKRKFKEEDLDEENRKKLKLKENEVQETSGVAPETLLDVTGPSKFELLMKSTLKSSGREKVLKSFKKYLSKRETEENQPNDGNITDSKPLGVVASCENGSEMSILTAKPQESLDGTDPGILYRLFFALANHEINANTSIVF
jgi:hypothetical protein